MKVTSIRWLCFVVAVVAMLAVSPVVNGQRGNFDNVEITTTQLDDNLYYLQGQGGQIGVLAGPRRHPDGRHTVCSPDRPDRCRDTGDFNRAD